MANYVPKPGYCYSWEGDEKDCPRTQDWDTDVLLEPEIDALVGQFRGVRVIDGARCAIWFAGMVRGYHRYVAQTCVFAQSPARQSSGDPIVF